MRFNLCFVLTRRLNAFNVCFVLTRRLNGF